METGETIRETLAEIFGMLEYKARNGALTLEDARAMLSAIQSGGGIHATVSDIAGYYRQSEDNVRHVLHRNYFPAPVRKVYYDFSAFVRAVPKKWHRRPSATAK